MFHKDSQQIKAFEAGDRTLLKEVIHPKNDELDLSFSLAHAILKPGESSLPHSLKESETYYFLSGHGQIVVEEESRKIGPGHVVVVPPKAKQHVVNESGTNLEFLCIVSPPWTEEGEEIL